MPAKTHEKKCLKLDLKRKNTKVKIFLNKHKEKSTVARRSCFFPPLADRSRGSF
jgi:hypothetical protein